MELKDVKNIYFIGIGGIGMSALARWFKAQGCEVAGYDRTSTPLTQQLQEEGINIHFEDRIDKIPTALLHCKKNEVIIVYTPAIPSDNQELNFFQQNAYPIKKRAEILGLITENYFTIAVAGTHGKTTTSSLIAYILHTAGKNCLAFLGGITQNFDSNLLLPKESKDVIVVVEADEYDRSFLNLYPNIAIITATDADHLDIYGTKEALKESFEKFIENIKEKGRLFLKKDLNLAQNFVNEEILTEEFSLTEGNYHAENLQIKDTTFFFDLVTPAQTLQNLALHMPGFHNVENSIAAAAAALAVGVSAAQIKEGLATFKGVKRRFEYVVKNDKIVYIDDYAHHPEEIRAFVQSVRALYPSKKITAVFQPHLYSRTKDFAEEFAESLSLVDALILLEIYPARELPMQGVSSSIIFDKVDLKNKSLCSKNNLVEKIDSLPIEVLVTIGAGDIDQYVEKIQKVLEAR